jgi:hypothetical protein
MAKSRIHCALFLACAILLTGCENLEKAGPENPRITVEKMTYVKDRRTNQCYAVLMPETKWEKNSWGPKITWVPCTPEIEALAANNTTPEEKQK